VIVCFLPWSAVIVIVVFWLAVSLLFLTSSFVLFSRRVLFMWVVVSVIVSLF